MTRPSTKPRHGFSYLLALFAALAMALVLARQVGYGVALHWDSSYYVSVARNLLAGDGFQAFDGGYQTIYPPLYPLLLALAGIGSDPLAAAGPLNAAIFGVTAFVAGSYLRGRLRHWPRLLAAWACLAVALSVPVAGQAAFALSEPVFVLLAVLALIGIDRFMADGKPQTLIWTAVLSALAWQTRYMGIALLATITLLLAFSPGSWRTRTKHVAIYWLIAATPMAAWICRNWLLIGAPTGKQVPVDYTLAAVLGDAGSAMWAWTHFELAALHWLPLGLALPLTAVVAVVGCLLAIRRRVRRVPFEWRPVLAFGGFGGVYLLLFLAALLFGYAPDGVQGRYLAPLYLPLVLVAACTLDWCFAPRGNGGGRMLGGALPLAVVASLAVWLAVGAVLNARDIDVANRDGVEGSLNPLLATETLRYVEQHLAGRQIYSNVPVLIHLLDGHAAHGRNGLLNVETTTYVPPNAYAVWFRWQHANQQDQRTAFEASALLAWARLQPLIERPEGSIWYRPGLSADSLAYFLDSPSPMVGKRAAVGLADGCRRAQGRNPWRWQVGGDGTWRDVLRRRGPTWAYTPVQEDAGHRLRAHVFCIDGDGQRVEATTAESPIVSPFSSFPEIANAVFEPLLEGPPAARAVFDIRVRQRKLIYTKAPCAEQDTAAPFFLHIEPVAVAVLPRWRRAHGFENFDFDFGERGMIAHGRCLGVFPLPKYAIAAIRTGQIDGNGAELWSAATDGLENPQGV